jgi:energy-coupling factor transporter ATP-binding protein EcfA2
MSQYMTTIKELALFLMDVLETDRDAVLVITGETGEGKSVLNWHLARACSKEAGSPFDPATNLVYEREEFKNLIDNLPEKSFIGVDEAVGLFYSRDYHDDEQIALLKKLDRIRYRHLITTFLIPSLWHIDSHIRNARVRLWIHVDTRKGRGKDGYAHAYIFKKEKNPFNPDPWNMNENRRMFAKGRIDKSPNYMGEIVFYDIKAAESRIYVGVKDTKRKMAEAKEWKRAVMRKRRGEKPDPSVVKA